MEIKANLTANHDLAASSNKNVTASENNNPVAQAVPIDNTKNNQDTVDIKGLTDADPTYSIKSIVSDSITLTSVTGGKLGDKP